MRSFEYVKSSNDYYFEYKWDGIRVQLVAKDGSTTIFPDQVRIFLIPFQRLKLIVLNY